MCCRYVVSMVSAGLVLSVHQCRSKQCYNSVVQVRPLAEAQKRQMTEQGVADRTLQGGPGPGQAVVGTGQGGPGHAQGGPGLQMGPVQGAHGPAQGVAGPFQPAGPPGPHQQLATSASQPMAAQSGRHDMSQSGRFSALSNPSSFMSGHQVRSSSLHAVIRAFCLHYSSVTLQPLVFITVL